MIDQTTSSILIAEDDPKTSRLIESYLLKESFATITASNGNDAIRLFAAHLPRLVILDVMLPFKDGFAVCTAIRKTSNVPILFLTARDEEIDKLVGLELGGDDYMVKPFSPRELVARVKAILRRSQLNTERETDQKVTIAGIVLDTEKRRFTRHGTVLNLTPLEYSLLKTLITSPGRVFLRAELLDRLYPDGELVVDRVIDVHIGKLRLKIGDDPTSPTYIHTVRGIGYRFLDGEEC